MYAFFVLGLVPGTNIQISFQGWLAMFMLVMGVIALFIIRGNRRREWQLVPIEVRVPLPANQLHRRVQ